MPILPHPASYSRKPRSGPSFPPPLSTPSIDPLYQHTLSSAIYLPRLGQAITSHRVFHDAPTPTRTAFLIWHPSRTAIFFSPHKVLLPHVPALLSLASSPHAALLIPQLPVSITRLRTLLIKSEDHPRIDAHLQLRQPAPCATA